MLLMQLLGQYADCEMNDCSDKYLMEYASHLCLCLV